jgi:hypothetical protein
LLADDQWIPLNGHEGEEIKIGGKNLWIETYLPHAAVVKGQLLSLSSKPENPVVKVKVEEAGQNYSHTVFAKFPELPTQYQGPRRQDLKLRLLMIPEDLGRTSNKNEMVLALSENGSGYFASQQGGPWSQARPFVLGQEIETGWMDFRWLPQKYYSHAKTDREYRKIPVPPGQKGASPAAHLVLNWQGQQKELWLGRGESQDLVLGSRSFKIAYGMKSLPLGFELKLHDFKMGTYEGTADPASYESEVRVMDPQRRVNEDHRIYMNHPLSYGKYKIFQASYQMNPDGSALSIFSVAYDPGIWVKYLGAIVLVTGIILIFFFRPLFLKRRSAVRAQEKGAVRGVAAPSRETAIFPIRTLEP